MDAWFRRSDDSDEHSFETIGVDGGGGHFAVWHRPNQDGPPPLVFFASDGGACILCLSVWDWPLIMAHGVGSSEYDAYKSSDDVTPAEPDPHANEQLGNQPYVGRPEPHPDPYVQAAFDRYREKVKKRCGELPPLSDLVAGREELRVELTDWLRRMRSE